MSANVSRTSYGGLLSLLAFVAAVIFFGFATFSASLGSILLVPAGLFCLAIAFVLERFSL